MEVEVSSFFVVFLFAFSDSCRCFVTWEVCHVFSKESFKRNSFIEGEKLNFNVSSNFIKKLDWDWTNYGIFIYMRKLFINKCNSVWQRNVYQLKRSNFQAFFLKFSLKFCVNSSIVVEIQHLLWNWKKLFWIRQITEQRFSPTLSNVGLPIISILIRISLINPSH